jgi:hypothetical protein
VQAIDTIAVGYLAALAIANMGRQIPEAHSRQRKAVKAFYPVLYGSVQGQSGSLTFLSLLQQRLESDTVELI